MHRRKRPRRAVVVVLPQEGFTDSNALDEADEQRAKEVLLVIGWLGLQLCLGFIGRDSPSTGHY